ncbi:MAG TPA: RodZ domain-containing protein [Geobacteraceae bacterium]
MPVTTPDKTKATAIGTCLREAREEQGKSLDEAARITRIGKNYLIAIEGGMFEKLPNSAYVKGFLRIYAKYLGLADDELVARFEESTVPAVSKPADTGTSTNPSRSSVPAGKSRGQWVIPFVLLMLILAFALFMGKKNPGEEKTLPVVPTEQSAAPSPLQPPRSSASATGMAPTPAQPPSDSVTTSTSEVGGKGIILRLKVNQDCQLNITIDDVISQPYDLKAGDMIEWKAEKSFTLDVTNAGGIEAEFNGKPLKPFGEAGKSAHIVLKDEGTPR